VEEIVEKYIMVRDKVSELDRAHKQKTEKLKEILKKLEAALLVQFSELGMESVRTKNGTAYKQVRTSATVADWEQALDYIRDNELWNMLERRVSKQAVEEFKDEHGDIPPGINIREEIVVNVRRSA